MLPLSSRYGSCQQKVVYRWVIDDVTKNVQEDFLNDGVDPQVLVELKQVRILIS